MGAKVTGRYTPGLAVESVRMIEKKRRRTDECHRRISVYGWLVVQLAL